MGLELEEAVKFHGHLCPMFYLGLRMGEKALKELDRDREKGVKLLAAVEFRNCLADGIQYACGTTYGKNNLSYKEHGKFACSFHDLASNKTIRIRVKNQILEDTLSYGIRGKEVKSLPPTEREKEARDLLQWGQRIVNDLEKMQDEDLFTVTKGEAIYTEGVPSLEYVICTECGEVVLTGYLKLEGARKICKACRADE
ncbi:MAG: FmdE family protein [Candidatus Hydrothermarchaeales archaeon]